MNNPVESGTRESSNLPPSDRGVRLDWSDIPERVRSDIERWLDCTVVDAITQPTGFSPGVAARLAARSGRRVFVKAVGPEPNADAPGIHRREIRIVSSIPCSAPVPRLLWCHDEGEGGWVVLVFEDIDGRHPMQPWQIGELDRVTAALENLNMLLTPSPLPASLIGAAGERFVRGWRRLCDERPSHLDRLDEWSRRHLEALAAIEDTVGGALEGDTLLNVDIRADNILFNAEGTWFVDWPHAMVGPPWLDIVAFAPSVAMQGGPPPEKVIARHSKIGATAHDSITTAIVALAGYFTYQAVQPPPPGIPTVRAFQEAQGAVARGWIAQRTGLS